jgi:hypothetical protein
MEVERRLVFRVHAVRRMGERGFDLDAVWGFRGHDS